MNETGKMDNEKEIYMICTKGSSIKFSSDSAILITYKRECLLSHTHTQALHVGNMMVEEING